MLYTWSGTFWTCICISIKTALNDALNGMYGKIGPFNQKCGNCLTFFNFLSGLFKNTLAQLFDKAFRRNMNSHFGASNILCALVSNWNRSSKVVLELSTKISLFL